MLYIQRYYIRIIYKYIADTCVYYEASTIADYREPEKRYKVMFMRFEAEHNLIQNIS